jgi:hypothetical protein
MRLQASSRAVRISAPLTAALAAAGAAAAAATFTDDFSGMPTDACIADGSAIGAWTFVYNGYGCNAFLFMSGNTVLMEQPQPATAPDETHGSLVVGARTSGDVIVQVSAATTRQLRSGSVPNPWEVGWVIWNYTDDTHFYYFIPKPNGWELGKADPAYPGAQRFLATGSSPAFPIGAWYRVRVVQTGNTIQVSVDGRTITTFTDAERPYTSGHIGLYSEDAEALFDDVSIGAPEKPRGKKPR